MTEYVAFEVEPGPVKLRADDYFMLGAAGALKAYVKTELIDGVIVAMSPAHSLTDAPSGDANGRVLHPMLSPGPDSYADRDETPFGERLDDTVSRASNRSRSPAR